MTEGIKEHNVQIQVEMVFSRVLCNDVPVECLQTLSVFYVITLHKHLNIFRVTLFQYWAHREPPVT